MLKTKPIRKASIPTYKRLQEEFRSEIENGVWRKNALIPTEKDLVAKYNASRETIRKALRNLENEGLLMSEQGRGRTVLGSDGIENNINCNNIGIVVNRLAFDSYGEFAKMQDIAYERNYNLTLYTFRHEDASSSKYLEDISKSQVAGLLIYCQQIQKGDIFEFGKYFPTVSLYHNCREFGLPSYYIPWHWAAFEATNYLIKTGHNNVYIILPQEKHFTELDADVYDGYRYAIQKNSMKIDNSKILYSPGIAETDNCEETSKIIKQIKEGEKVGVVTYYNRDAVNLVKAAIEDKISIPDKLSIFDLVDSSYLQNSPISISAIEYDRISMVSNALNRLLDMIENKNSKYDGFNGIDNPTYGQLAIRNSTF